eukprot:3895851-Rhodomonas_salina.2
MTVTAPGRGVGVGAWFSSVQELSRPGSGPGEEPELEPVALSGYWHSGWHAARACQCTRPGHGINHVACQ